MSVRSRIVEIALGALLLAVSGGAPSARASGWDEGFHSRVRLVSGGPDQGRLLAGVEIVLDPGFKTYWRNPGESGLPPRFDWSGSTNVQAVELKWPRPERSEDPTGVSFGYHGGVTFPVVIRPRDPAKPVGLALSVDYGICRDICIPAHAELALTLSEDDAPSPAVTAALDAVPRPQALGAPGDLAILDVAPVPGDGSTFRVAFRAPDGSSPDLFAEGPDGFFLSTAPAPDGAFLLKVEERPRETSGAVSAVLTLVAGNRAVETEIRLDAMP
jgi:DsbC/DsbD-like thiol-disulfide interchange protein